jgi:hypothetical protein
MKLSAIIYDAYMFKNICDFLEINKVFKLRELGKEFDEFIMHNIEFLFNLDTSHMIVKLFTHQKINLARIQEKLSSISSEEKVKYIGGGHKIVKHINYYYGNVPTINILSDHVGSGKTITVISCCSRKNNKNLPY